MPFRSLGLRAELLRAVSDEGYDQPTPVQTRAIPVVLAGRDLMAEAQTGTGKTAAFILPLLQLLGAPTTSKSGAQGAGEKRGRVHPVRALILTPTRELAAQVEESVKTYGKYMPQRSAVIFGGVSAVPQLAALRKGVDIVVATPGRLLDHINQKNIDLSRIEVLILDEADRMLDMGFIRDIRKILAVLPRDRQNLLFSATFSDEIKKLAGEILRSPEMVQVDRRNAPPELVAQVIHPVDRNRKRELLSHLISSGKWKQVLVFTRTKHGANRLAQQLEMDGITAMAIHGNKSQGARTQALGSFKRGTLRVLVATDIASRGLDIDQLPHVVNYELPHVPEDYVHRIGRTGRAGTEGAAVSLVCVDEHKLLADIERLLKRDLPRTTLRGFEPDPSIKAEPIVKGRAPAGGGKPRASRPAASSRSTAGSHRNPRAAADSRPSSGSRRTTTSRPESDSRRGPRATAQSPRAQAAATKPQRAHAPATGSQRAGAPAMKPYRAATPSAAKASSDASPSMGRTPRNHPSSSRARRSRPAPRRASSV
jgi:ATP-dependent RNA helicase RhlE